MSRPNSFQTFAHCWRFALRRAAAEGDTFTSSRRACHRLLAPFSPIASCSRATSLPPRTSRHPPIHFCPGSASMDGSSAVPTIRPSPSPALSSMI